MLPNPDVKAACDDKILIQCVNKIFVFAWLNRFIIEVQGGGESLRPKSIQREQLH